MYSVLWILAVTSVALSSSQLQYSPDYRYNYATNAWELEPQSNWYYYSDNYEHRNDVPSNVDTTGETSRAPIIFNNDLNKYGEYDGPFLSPYSNVYRHYRCKCQKCYKVYVPDSQYYEPKTSNGLTVYRVEDKVYEPEQKYKFSTSREIEYPSDSARETYLSPIINNDNFIFFKPLTSMFSSKPANEFLNNLGAENVNYYKDVNDLPNYDLPQIFPPSVDTSFNERKQESRDINEKSSLPDYQGYQLNNELAEIQKLKSTSENLYKLLPALNHILNNFEISVEIKETSFRFPKNSAKNLKEES